MTIKVLKTKAPEPDEKRTRAVSGVAYPYFDHEASIRVADIVQNVGGGSCAPDFLAAKLEYKSIASGTYLTRVAAARMFGYVTMSGGNFVVTERGRAILSPVMPEDSINGKAEGFLAVRLFSRVFDDFRGKSLPPEIGLKNLFLNNYKIVPDRVPSALRVFLNSADQCGFFDHGRDRLITPASNHQSHSTPQPTAAVDAPSTQSEQVQSQDKPRGTGGGSGDGGGIHSALIGLLRELPKPGDAWSPTDQTDFIQAFTGLIKFIYPAKKAEAKDA